jgi:3-oxoacyl-[acyl-carrier-protein] synthase III
MTEGVKRIGIGAIGVALPGRRETTALAAPALGIEPGRLARRLGFRALARKEDGEDSSDLALTAIRALEAKGVALRELECLVAVTQNPDGLGIPPVSTILHGRLDLPQAVASFDIAHGCAGFVYGAAIAKSFMEANGMRRGLLVTVDPYSKIVDRQDPHTALIFGDAAAATLLTDAPEWDIGRTDFGSDGASRSALERRDSGLLYMNGKRIARLCGSVVPHSIARALAINHLTLEDVDEVLLHQGSRYIVETIGAAIGAPDKTPFYAADYGNLVSSSIPVALADQVSAKVATLVLSGFGVGLAWATTVIRRRERE